MLIVAVNGSPNRDGNTAYLLNVVLEEVKSAGAETRMLQVMDALEGQERPYCIACGSPCPEKCHENPNLARAFDLLRKADALVVGSPVYFGTVSAPLKAFWDKSRNLRGEKVLVGKPGASVSVGAASFGGQETTVRAIQDILFVQGMSIVGDGSTQDGAGHQGVCAKRPAAEDDSAISSAKVLGRRLVEEVSRRSE